MKQPSVELQRHSSNTHTGDAAHLATGSMADRSKPYDGKDTSRPLLSPRGSENSPSPQPSATQQVPDFEDGERPPEIRVTFGEPAAAEAAAAEARARTVSAATPTHIIVGSDDPEQPASARPVGRMSSGIHIDIHTRGILKDGHSQARRAAFRGHLVPTDPEGAARRWRQQRTLLLVWFALSGVSIILCMWWLELGAVAGILGIAGACIPVCNCPSDLNMAVSGTRIMSILAMMMSLLVALVCTYIASMMPCTAPHFDQRTCDLFHIMLFGVAAWFACMSGLAGAIAYQTTQIKLLLEPKTQGVLTLH